MNTIHLFLIGMMFTLSDAYAQCRLVVQTDTNPVPFRSGNNQIKSTAWIQPAEPIIGTWSVTMSMSLKFIPQMGGAELTVVSQPLTFSWDGNVGPGFGSRKSLDLTFPLQPYGSGFYFTRVEYSGTCSGSTLYISPDISTQTLVRRPERPDYHPSTGIVLTFLGNGISHSGSYHAVTDIVPGATNGAVGTPSWTSAGGRGALSCTNCSNPQFIATSASSDCNAYDVQIFTSYDGFLSEPFFVFINRPLTISTPMEEPAALHEDREFGYLSTLAYSVTDLCGQAMFNYDINEIFSPPAFFPDQPNDWFAPDPNGTAIPGYDFTDMIGIFGALASFLNPVPMAPQSPLGTEKVDHAFQNISFGSQQPGQGVCVRRHVLQRYRDHGAHENASTCP